jgi:excisionase family DNA binding protein
VLEVVSDEMLSAKEAAIKAGVSLRTIYKWVSDGVLPASRLGTHLLRVRSDDISNTLKAIEVRKVVRDERAIPKPAPARVAELKTCISCGEAKSSVGFPWISNRRHYGSKCRRCVNQVNRESYARNGKTWASRQNRVRYTEKDREYSVHYRARCVPNAEAVRKRKQDYHRKLKQEVMTAYGNECVCCGETSSKFLTLDHVNNDGGAHRKAIGGSGVSIYQWARRNGYPNKLQILCWNCNMGKKVNGGECPHVQQRTVILSLVKSA